MKREKKWGQTDTHTHTDRHTDDTHLGANYSRRRNLFRRRQKRNEIHMVWLAIGLSWLTIGIIVMTIIKVITLLLIVMMITHDFKS